MSTTMADTQPVHFHEAEAALRWIFTLGRAAGAALTCDQSPPLRRLISEVARLLQECFALSDLPPYEPPVSRFLHERLAGRAGVYISHWDVEALLTISVEGRPELPPLIIIGDGTEHLR